MVLLLDAKIRVLIADDHPIFLAGIRSFLTGHRRIEVVGEATSAAQTIQLLAQTRPSIAVAEASLNGIPMINHIIRAAPDVRVICLSEHDDDAHVREAIAAGVRGYVLKRSTCENLLGAIEAVNRGEVYVDSALAGQVSAVFRPKPDSAKAAGQPKHALTERERTVLKLIALGYTNREVADKLGVTIKSVETYKTRASAKLDIDSRPKIIQYAILQGWLHEGVQ